MCRSPPAKAQWSNAVTLRGAGAGPPRWVARPAHTGPVTHAERFRRLARSSPWLWTSVRFTHEDGDLPPVRAWVRRPQALRVESLAGELLLADPGRPTPTHVSRLLGPGDPPREAPAPVWWTDPTAPRPPRDRQGLVVDPVQLPSTVVLDDPMWQTYRWVAMLNPRELADTATGEPAVELDDLREVDRFGRSTLWATVRPGECYDPRCACCPLLPSRPAALAEGYPDPDGPFAEAHRVALDAATGICVSAREVGGPTPGRGFDLVIEGVDEDLRDDLFATGSTPTADRGLGRMLRGWARHWPARPGSVGGR